jgi:hypothetical protein
MADQIMREGGEADFPCDGFITIVEILPVES